MHQVDSRDDYQSEVCPLCSMERGRLNISSWEFHLAICVSIAENTDKNEVDISSEIEDN